VREPTPRCNPGAAQCRVWGHVPPLPTHTEQGASPRRASTPTAPTFRRRGREAKGSEGRGWGVARRGRAERVLVLVGSSSLWEGRGAAHSSPTLFPFSLHHGAAAPRVRNSPAPPVVVLSAAPLSRAQLTHKLARGSARAPGNERRTHTFLPKGGQGNLRVRTPNGLRLISTPGGPGRCGGGDCLRAGRACGPRSPARRGKLCGAAASHPPSASCGPPPRSRRAHCGFAPHEAAQGLGRLVPC
jgi:hypothetical protein